MLKCKEVTEQASDYIDHNLSWRQRLSVVVHLFICHYCRRFIRHLRITRNFGQRRPSPVANDDEVASVMEKIKKS